MNVLPKVNETEYSQNTPLSAAQFTLESTRITPYVLIDREREYLIIAGRSSPENAEKFYNQISSYLKTYIESGASNLIANFNFEYYNTSSAKCLFGLFEILKTAKEKGVNTTINWHYEIEDEDMLECGEDYAEILDIEFNYIMISHE